MAPDMDRGRSGGSGGSGGSDGSDSSNSDNGGFISTVSDKVQTAKDKGKQAADTVEETAEGVGRKVGQTVSTVKDTSSETKRRLAGTYEGTKKSVSEAGDTVEKKAETVGETAGETVSRVEKTGDAVEERARTVGKTAGEAVSKVEEKKRTAERKVERTKEKAGSVKESADSVADDIVGDPPAGDRGHQTGYRGIAGGLETEEGRERTNEAIREHAGEPAAELREEEADFDPEVADDLTGGGTLSETKGSNEGFVPGEIGGYDVSEDRLRSGAEWVDSYKDRFDENPDVTVAGSDVPERVLEGAASSSVDLLNLPQHALMVEKGVEVAGNSPGAVKEHGWDVAETSAAFGAAAAGSMATEAKENPVEFTAGLGMDMVAGAGITKAAKETVKTARVARKSEVDATDVTNKDTVDYYEGGNANPDDRFPGFRPEGDEAPINTFRRQGEDHTPDEVKRELGEASDTETYTTHGTNYDFDSEFEAGIEKGRPSDPDNAMFVGPEFSPAFAGFEAGGSGLSSLRPRLPRASDFSGSDKQMIISRMDVDEVPGRVGKEAETGGSPMAPGAESRYLADKAEQGVAYVRNAKNRNMGEAEALVPGGSTFRELDSSGQFYTQIDGEPVDIRLFETDGRKADIDAGDGTGYPNGPVDETGLYSMSEMPSSGRTTPEGTPVFPAFSGGYGGSAGAGGGPMSIDETGLSREQTPPSSRGSSGNIRDDYGLDVGPSRDLGRSPDPDGSTSSTSSGDRGDPSSPPSSGAPDSSGFPYSYVDETGGLSSPGSSGGSSDPVSPPSSPPGGPSSQSPTGPPSWTPPGYGSSGSSGSPGSPGSPGGSSGPASPISPFDPTGGTRPRWETDRDRRRDDEDELEGFGAYDIGFANPIAGGADVLFGGFGGGFGAAQDDLMPFDETGGKGP